MISNLLILNKIKFMPKTAFHFNNPSKLLSGKNAHGRMIEMIKEGKRKNQVIIGKPIKIEKVKTEEKSKKKTFKSFKLKI